MLSKGNLLLHGKGSNEEYAIRIEGLTKTYRLYKKSSHRMREALHPLGKIYHKEFFALRDVSFSVKKGEILGIVGRNGAGKSTLLQILSGVLEPSAGIVDVRGKVTALLELGTGFNPELTGLENVYFYGTIRGQTYAQTDEILEEIKNFAEIGEFFHQPLKTYSSGMRTRLGFAVAVYMHPQILILDEVLAVGDELFKRKCFAKMEELFERGCTVLFVSHSVNSVNQICERALFFDNGRLIMEGPTKLVTLGYQRFLFSNDHEKPAVLKELMAVNLDRESQCGGQIEETQPQAEDFGAWEDVDNINDDFFDLLKSFSEKPTACFLPEFVSKSETVTRNHDIDIEDLRIVSANGKRVNVLVSNEKYMVAFRVRFNQPASRVFFHVSFKTEKGFKLGSDVVPNVPQRIDNISPGGVFEVEWRFTCTFLKGNFYISIGVHSSDSENDSILYRIDDGYVFKVVNPVNFSYRGFVHFNQRGAIYRIGPMDEREAILLKNEISEQ